MNVVYDCVELWFADKPETVAEFEKMLGFTSVPATGSAVLYSATKLMGGSSSNCDASATFPLLPPLSLFLQLSPP
jgi:hypothetical protein